jgi:hypothetical protein
MPPDLYLTELLESGALDVAADVAGDVLDVACPDGLAALPGLGARALAAVRAAGTPHALATVGALAVVAAGFYLARRRAA